VGEAAAAAFISRRWDDDIAFFLFTHLNQQRLQRYLIHVVFFWSGKYILKKS
jgi:hypothetical protein